MDYKNKYYQWIESNDFDDETKAELKAIEKDEKVNTV